MRPRLSGWPASISDGFLPASMACRARCCRCRPDVVFSRHARNMPRSRWRATAGCAAPQWPCNEFRAVIRGVARGDLAASIQCRRGSQKRVFCRISLSRLAQAPRPSLRACKWKIKTGRIGIPASARTVPARRTPEASRNDRDSRQSSIHRRHGLAVEAFALNCSAEIERNRKSLGRI